MDYLFESDGHLIGFQHGDTYGKLYRYLQVLSVVTLQRKESNKFYMYTLQKLGDATVEHDNLKPFSS